MRCAEAICDKSPPVIRTWRSAAEVVVVAAAAAAAVAVWEAEWQMRVCITQLLHQPQLSRTGFVVIASVCASVCLSVYLIDAENVFLCFF